MDFEKIMQMKTHVAANEKITNEQIERIINAGWWTGTSFNLQPWKCIVLRDRHKEFWSNFIRIISVLLKSNPLISTIGIKQDQYVHYRDNADVTLILCANEDKFKPWFSGPIFVNDGVKATFFKDMGAVFQNLKLAIVNENLGYDQVNTDLSLKGLDEALQGYLELPDGYRIIGILTLGKPEAYNTEHDFPLKSFIYHEQWRRRMKGECPRATSCQRFELDKTPVCAVCKEVIMGNSFYHHENRLFLCHSHFSKWQDTKFDKAYLEKVKLTNPVKLNCTFWNDCDDFNLHVPLACSGCQQESTSFYREFDSGNIYCLNCYQNRA